MSYWPNQLAPVDAAPRPRPSSLMMKSPQHLIDPCSSYTPQVSPVGLAPAPMGFVPSLQHMVPSFHHMVPSAAPMEMPPLGPVPRRMPPLGVPPLGMAPRRMPPLGTVPFGMAPLQIPPMWMVPSAASSMPPPQIARGPGGANQTCEGENVNVGWFADQEHQTPVDLSVTAKKDGGDVGQAATARRCRRGARSRRRRCSSCAPGMDQYTPELRALEVLFEEMLDSHDSD